MDIVNLSKDLLSLETAARGFATLSVVQGGTFTIDLSLFVDGASPGDRRTVPCLCFIVAYQGADNQKKRILYDLGMRRDISEYPQRIQDQLPHHHPLETHPDVKQRLVDANLSPENIDQVILSHMHWDHSGTPSDFPNATFTVGHGALALLDGPPDTRNAHNNFSKDLFDGLCIQELPDPNSGGEWKEVGGRKVRDVTGGGFIYVVDSPGHLVGHISLLVRLGRMKWVLLIGDSCHDARLLSGERDIAQWKDAQGFSCCVHGDREAAAQTLKVFRAWEMAAVECKIGLHIVFAHDLDWARAHPEAFLPGAYSF